MVENLKMDVEEPQCEGADCLQMKRDGVLRRDDECLCFIGGGEFLDPQLSSFEGLRCLEVVMQQLLPIGL